MDIVDNSGLAGELPLPRPLSNEDRPLTARCTDQTIPSPGDGTTSVATSGVPEDHTDGATVTSGRDLARDALRSAREAAAARGHQPGEVKGRRRQGRGRGGQRRGWSGARPDDRDPQPFGRLASRLVAERGWREPLASASVLGRWAELVGADIAEHAKPISLRDGELTVVASSTAWATQLRTLQRQLLVKIAAGVGPGVVRRLRVSGPAAPSWRKGPRTVPGRGPRDTYG